MSSSMELEPLALDGTGAEPIAQSHSLSSSSSSTSRRSDRPHLAVAIDVAEVERSNAGSSSSASAPSSATNVAMPVLNSTVTRRASSPVRTASNKQLFFIKTCDSPSSLHSDRSRHVHSRKVTRDIAALDFLQNIPMQSELVAAVAVASDQQTLDTPGRKSSLSAAQRGGSTTGDANATGGDHDAAGDAVDAVNRPANESLAGRRMPGFDATMVHVPSLFRYRFTTKYPAASAVVRRWEGSTVQQGLLESRLFFSRGCGYPVATSTVIKYNGNETARRKRFTSVGNLEPMSYDWRGKSYYRLMHATWASCDKDRDSQDDHPTVVPYMANYLDDPEFRQGRHRHVVRGDKKIGPVVSSILLFVKPNDLKEELNKKFQEKHTWLLDTDLNLSKIRNLKRETLVSCQRLNMEVATAALACVYFEKLVLSHYVTKANRKLYMSICFLLAAKFSEPKASEAMKTTIKQILEEIDHVHSIPSREVLTNEFTIYAQLSFSLHVPLSEVHPHFTRLLKLIESNPRKYLDDDVFAAYSAHIMDETNAQFRGMDPSGSIDGETQNEDTDGEVLMSDDDEGGEHAEDDPSLFSRWNQVSFSKWWKRRQSVGRREPLATAVEESASSN